MRTLPGTWPQRGNVPNHDAKHAAVQSTETLGALHALSTSTGNAKARWVQRGTMRTIAPRRDIICTHSAKKLGTMRSDAQRGRVLHAVVKRTGLRRTFSVLNTYCTACNEKGHNSTNCPNSHCACNTCGLFWHLPNDCPFVNCVYVAIDWLNILRSTKSIQVVNAYFEEVSLPPTSYASM